MSFLIKLFFTTQSLTFPMFKLNLLAQSATTPLHHVYIILSLLFTNKLRIFILCAIFIHDFALLTNWREVRGLQNRSKKLFTARVNINNCSVFAQDRIAGVEGRRLTGSKYSYIDLTLSCMQLKHCRRQLLSLRRIRQVQIICAVIVKLLPYFSKEYVKGVRVINDLRTLDFALYNPGDTSTYAHTNNFTFQNARWQIHDTCELWYRTVPCSHVFLRWILLAHVHTRNVGYLWDINLLRS